MDKVGEANPVATTARATDVGYLRLHRTKSHDFQVRVRGAQSNVQGVNVTKAVIGAYMYSVAFIVRWIITQ